MFRSDVQVEPPEEVPAKSESITGVGIQKVERKFAVRNVTELVVDAGQQTDRGRETRSNDVDEPVRSVKPAGRIERQLRNKRGFSELWIQKDGCVIFCGKQLCSFPTLNEQESNQTRQMDRGEIEVEEERRVKMKRMPALPTDREKHENESAHVANRSRCKTEDSREHLENESSVSRVAMDRGFLVHGTDAYLVTNTKLYRSSTARWPSVRCPTKVQSLVQSTVCWKTLMRVAGAKCCSRKMLGLPPRHSSTQFGSDEVRG